MPCDRGVYLEGVNMHQNIASSILLERKILGRTTVESKVRVGKDTIVIKSIVNGRRALPDIMFDIICQKEGA